jgi:hypothetical protein
LERTARFGRLRAYQSDLFTDGIATTRNIALIVTEQAASLRLLLRVVMRVNASHYKAVVTPVAGLPTSA